MRRRELLTGSAALALSAGAANAFGIGELGANFGRLGVPLGSKPGPQVIGGATVGQPGTGFYSAYTLSWGNDFNSLDVVGPQAPKASFFPTHDYGAYLRGNITTLGTAYEADPLSTGYNDSNRGVPVGFSNMSQSGSVLRLGARKSTTQEQAFQSPTAGGINGGVRPQLSSMIHTAGVVGFYPTTNPVIVEVYMRLSPKATNPAGWHPDVLDLHAGTGCRDDRRRVGLGR